MSRKLQILFISAIVVIAALLRLYRLGEVPPALDWDEVSLAYNAWSLAETGRDEFGNSWPASIRSFGDYKPPMYTYTLMPSLALFGKSEFAVRFPSALAGTLTVLVTYWLVKELVDQKVRRALHVEHREDSAHSVQRTTYMALISAFLLAISPWHLQFSRIAFEANLALFFFVVSLWQFLRWLNQHAAKWSILFSTLFFSAALMSYHSARVVIPLIFLVVALIYREQILNNIKRSLFISGLSIFIAFITVILIIYTIAFQRVGQSRFNETSFLTIDNLTTVSQARVSQFNANPLDRLVNHRQLVYGKQFLRGYFDHFDLKFWLLRGDSIDRHHAPDVGLLYFWEFPFFVIGLISLITNNKSLITLRTSIMLFTWFLLAPAASALTGGTPSAVRSLLFLPTFQIFSAIGLVSVLRLGGRLPKLFITFIIFIIFIGEFAHYLHQYYAHAPVEQAFAWQYGYKQLVSKVIEEEKLYDKVIITTAYDQPYIYFLWYGSYSPGVWINDGEFNKRFDKFEFRKIDWGELQDRRNVLVIASPAEIKSRPVKWQVNFPDGYPVFLATEL